MKLLADVRKASDFFFGWFGWRVVKNRGYFFDSLDTCFLNETGRIWTGFGAYHPYQKRIVEFV